MNLKKGAPAAGQQTGATDKPIMESLLTNDNTNDSLLEGYPPVGTLEQAASILQLGVTTARQMCREEILPSFKCGAQWRVPREWLERFINEGGSR